MPIIAGDAKIFFSKLNDRIKIHENAVSTFHQSLLLAKNLNLLRNDQWYHYLDI